MPLSVKKITVLTIFFLRLSVGVISSQEKLSLNDAVIITPESLNKQRASAIRMLIEEVEIRTSITLKQILLGEEVNKAAIVISNASEWNLLAEKYGLRKINPTEFEAKEGYNIRTGKSKNKQYVCIIGNDDRGFLFGIGHILRIMKMEQGSISIEQDVNIKTSPEYPLRGHQIGYRPKPNSYDGWTPAMMEKYIRELAIFGTNAIELIPPRSDDAATSPHFPVSQPEMMTLMSEICDSYGLDVWIWYPAIDKDYSDPVTLQTALDEWGGVFRSLPRVDAVFVPCGDPGTTPPDMLFDLLEKQAKQLEEIHPSAEWWVAPQGFDEERLERFHELVSLNPVWLKGIVYGPWMRKRLQDFRKWIPVNYPIRHYPDITHTVYCQYPVPEWDMAFAYTYGREPINPRPLDMKKIFRLLQPYTIGFIAYSEGCNDDVNKFIWSGLGWDSKIDPKDILREYSRFFIGPAYEDSFSEAILSLEQNWKGALLSNTSVDSTFKKIRTMEQNAPPQVLLNWRFQQVLFRAYYDAYIRKRLIFETETENRALEVLRKANTKNADNAVKQAISILNSPFADPATIELKIRTFALGEALFQSVRMQMHTAMYKAGRPDGAVLDRIDTPLNNKEWKVERLNQAISVQKPEEKLAVIYSIINWRDPGAGGFYDNLGFTGQQPHLVKSKSYEEDPAFLESPLISPARVSKPIPLSWKMHVKGLYDIPIQMKYEELDRTASYKVRVVYAGGPMMLKANGKVIHDFINRPFELLEFEIPREITFSGKLILEWYKPSGEGYAGRGNELCEVWLIKNKNKDKKNE